MSLPGTTTERFPRLRVITIVTILDLRTPLNFEQSYNGRVPEGIERNGKFKTRLHLPESPQYTHHLRILLADPAEVAEIEPRPARVPPIDFPAS